MLYKLNLGLQLSSDLWKLPFQKDCTTQCPQNRASSILGKEKIFYWTFILTHHPNISIHTPRYVYKQEIYTHILLYIYIQKI